MLNWVCFCVFFFLWQMKSDYVSTLSVREKKKKRGENVSVCSANEAYRVVWLLMVGCLSCVWDGVMDGWRRNKLKNVEKKRKRTHTGKRSKSLFSIGLCPRVSVGVCLSVCPSACLSACLSASPMYVSVHYRTLHFCSVHTKESHLKNSLRLIHSRSSD